MNKQKTKRDLNRRWLEWVYENFTVYPRDLNETTRGLHTVGEDMSPDIGDHSCQNLEYQPFRAWSGLNHRLRYR